MATLKLETRPDFFIKNILTI